MRVLGFTSDGSCVWCAQANVQDFSAAICLCDEKWVGGSWVSGMGCARGLGRLCAAVLHTAGVHTSWKPLHLNKYPSAVFTCRQYLLVLQDYDILLPPTTCCMIHIQVDPGQDQSNGVDLLGELASMVPCRVVNRVGCIGIMFDKWETIVIARSPCKIRLQPPSEATL